MNQRTPRARRPAIDRTEPIISVCRCRRSSGQRGWALLDMVFGLTLCVAFTGMIVVAANKAGKARRHLSHERSATRLAEAALLHAQAGQPISAFEGDDVTLRGVEGNTPAPAGYLWARAVARFGNAEASLVGLVPEGGLDAD